MPPIPNTQPISQMMPPYFPGIPKHISALETLVQWTRPPWVIPEGPEITTDTNERMSQYLDDQSSIARYPYIAQDQSTNENHDRIPLSGFDTDSVVGSQRLGIPACCVC